MCCFWAAKKEAYIVNQLRLVRIIHIIDETNMAHILSSTKFFALPSKHTCVSFDRQICVLFMIVTTKNFPVSNLIPYLNSKFNSIIKCISTIILGYKYLNFCILRIFNQYWNVSYPIISWKDSKVHYNYVLYYYSMTFFDSQNIQVVFFLLVFEADH